MRSNEFILETRNKIFQYIKSLLPGWPDYVLRDWIYPSVGKLDNKKIISAHYGYGLSKENILYIIHSEGLDINSNWKLVPDFPFQFDKLHPDTQRRIQSRAEGTLNPYNVPRDAERHFTQAKLIQQHGGVSNEPVIGILKPQGFDLIEGWHRTIQHFKANPTGYRGPAWVAKSIK